MMKRNLFDLARLLFVLASAMAFPAAAGEVFNSETHRRDVTIERYSPTATVVSVLVTNGGSYAATGTHSYAVAAAGLDWRVTSVASNVTVATGGLVRIQWKPLGGATNYYLLRNGTNYIAAGVVTQAFDYGTNAWTTGLLTIVTAAVPALYLPDSGYSPTGNMAVRASDVTGLSGSGYLQKTGDVMTGAMVLTNAGDGTSANITPDGTIYLQRPDYGDGAATLTINPETFSNSWWHKGGTLDADQALYVTNAAGGGYSQYYSAALVYQTEPLLYISKMINPIASFASTNWVQAQIALSSLWHTNSASRDYFFDRISHSGTRYMVLDQGNVGYFTGVVQSITLGGVTYYPTNGGRNVSIPLDLSTYATLADVQSSLTNVFVDIGGVPTQTQHGATRQMHVSTNGWAYFYAPKGGTNWWRMQLEPIP